MQNVQNEDTYSYMSGPMSGEFGSTWSSQNRHSINTGTTTTTTTIQKVRTDKIIVAII